MKNTSPRCETPAPRKVSVNDHAVFIESLLTQADHDEIDDMIDAPWPELNPPSRRKDSEVNRVLSIIDNLPTGKDEA
jgi:hypothetical protein